MEWDPWKVRIHVVLFFIVLITVLPTQLLIYGLGSRAAEGDTTAVFGIWQWEIASSSGKRRTCVLPGAMLGPSFQLHKISAIKPLLCQFCWLLRLVLFLFPCWAGQLCLLLGELGCI